MTKAVITHIDILKLDIPLSKPFRIALGVIDHSAHVVVRVHTGDGLCGSGECSPISFITGETQAIDLAATSALAQVLVGHDPLAIEDRVRDMDALLRHNTTAKSAFDLALYDLLGKYAGLPLYALLGGSPRPVYTDYTVAIDTPETMAAEALTAKQRGFLAIKVKLGTTQAEDVARIRAIRDRVGDDIPLRIDANQGWDPVTAAHILAELGAYGIQYCEQPVAYWNTTALHHLRQVSPIPIMADESIFDHHDAFRLASEGACDYLNIKLAKSGGIHKALKAIAVAEGAGMKCMLGCMSETRLALSAAAHLAAARPAVAFANLDGAFYHAQDPVAGGITYDGGLIHLPDAPGHGAEFRPEVLDALEGITIRPGE
jgi:L-alanine-DL-glutamate epimerase-like enolase superfamily enzyme